MSKRLAGVKGCKYKTSSWHLNGSPMEITLLGQQYNTVGEKPIVILYIYINHHEGTPGKTVKTNQKQCSTPSTRLSGEYRCWSFLDYVEDIYPVGSRLRPY